MLVTAVLLLQQHAAVGGAGAVGGALNELLGVMQLQGRLEEASQLHHARLGPGTSLPDGACTLFDVILVAG